MKNERLHECSKRRKHGRLVVTKRRRIGKNS